MSPIGSGRSALRGIVPLVALLASLLTREAPALAQRVYVVAVIPTAPPVALHTEWTPFLERLGRETGLQFRLKLFETMAAFEREIVAGSADFVYCSPIQAVVAHQSREYQPLVRGGKLQTIGLYVRRDSAIRTVDDLSGQAISFVGNKNACSVMIRHLLSEHHGSLSFITEYSGSSVNVIKNVLLGKSAAGAFFARELERESPENRALLRSVVETPKIAPHPICAHPRVPQAVRERVRQGILRLAADAEGRELLRKVRLEDAVGADYRRDYQPLEVVDIRRLTDWGK